MQRIKKGDEVVVLTGRDKGKRGTVLRRVDWRAILPARVWPTSPAPMIRVRSAKAARGHTANRASQRRSGTKTTASPQKATSMVTGASSPRAITRATRRSQLPTVRAEAPSSDATADDPPMLLPG